MNGSATIAPTSLITSDHQLAHRVKNFLLSRSAAGGGQVRVDADGGTITLAGTVSSFYHKQLWIHAAQRVAGVLRVIDEMDVRPVRPK